MVTIAVDGAIPEFRRKVDPGALVVGSVLGEQGPICRILKSEKYTYYVNYIAEFFRSFAYICKEPGGGIGESISQPQLMDAINNEHWKKPTWIIVIKPINYRPNKLPNFNNDVKYYGLLAKKWYQYQLDNPSALNYPKGRDIPNVSIPAKLLQNMEGFRNQIVAEQPKDPGQTTLF